MAAVLPSFIFVRHAETEWNALGLTMGQRDIPAKDSGLSLARAMNLSLSHKVPWIVSSSLKRARDTAAAFSQSSASVIVSDLWVERNWGPFQGQPKAFRPSDLNPPGVEPWSAFVARIQLGIKSLPDTNLGMVVSHSGVFKALVHIGYRPETGFIKIPHATPIILKYDQYGA